MEFLCERCKDKKEVDGLCKECLIKLVKSLEKKYIDLYKKISSLESTIQHKFSTSSKGW